MAIESDLYQALLKKTGWSAATLSRKANALWRDHGPMTPDEARYIIAHEHGIDLRKYGHPTGESRQGTNAEGIGCDPHSSIFS